MSYDDWKTTNPADDELGPEPECEECNGSGMVRWVGRDNSEEVEPCPECRGTGKAKFW